MFELPGFCSGAISLGIAANEQVRFRPSHAEEVDRVPWRGVADGLTTTIPAWAGIGQITMAGNPTMGSSLKGGHGFQRHVAGALGRPTRRSVPAGSRPTRRVIASSLGKMPTTLVRRLTSPFSRSSRIGRMDFRQWPAGKLI